MQMLAVYLLKNRFYMRYNNSSNHPPSSWHISSQIKLTIPNFKDFGIPTQSWNALWSNEFYIKGLLVPPWSRLEAWVCPEQLHHRSIGTEMSSAGRPPSATLVDITADQVFTPIFGSGPLKNLAHHQIYYSVNLISGCYVKEANDD